MLSKIFLSALLLGSMNPFGTRIYYEGEDYSNEDPSGHVMTPEENARILEIVSLGYNPYIAPEDDYSYGSANNPGYWTEDGTFVSTRQDAPVAYTEPAPSGYVKVGSFYANTQYGTDQWIVDAENLAATWVEGGTTIIADHAYQGFKAFTWCDTAEVNGVTYKKVSQYYGYNDGADVWLDDGRHISGCYDGELAMYTCTDTTGDRVVISYWTPSWNAPAAAPAQDSAAAPHTEEVTQSQSAQAQVKSQSQANVVKTSKNTVRELTETQKKHFAEKALSLYENF